MISIVSWLSTSPLATFCIFLFCPFVRSVESVWAQQKQGAARQTNEGQHTAAKRNPEPRTKRPHKTTSGEPSPKSPQTGRLRDQSLPGQRIRPLRGNKGTWSFQDLKRTRNEQQRDLRLRPNPLTKPPDWWEDPDLRQEGPKNSTQEVSQKTPSGTASTEETKLKESNQLPKMEAISAEEGTAGDPLWPSQDLLHPPNATTKSGDRQVHRAHHQKIKPMPAWKEERSRDHLRAWR